MMRLWTFVAVIAVFNCIIPRTSLAADVTVPISLVSADGVGASIGSIRAVDTGEGVRFEPALAGLPPGEHGFHLHENADCGTQMKDDKCVAGLAAGGHWDPDGTGRHLGPDGQGHRGDLPRLIVGPDGRATTPTPPAPRLRVADLQGRALVIHAGGDNYSDEPEPLGGGGARIACGVVP